MDQQQQNMKQTEKNIIEMLEFLDSSSEEEFGDIEKIKTEQSDKIRQEIIKKDINDNLIEESNKTNDKSKTKSKKTKKISTAIAKELNKLKEHYPILNTKEIVTTKYKLNSELKPAVITEENTEKESPILDFTNLEWHNKLETNCRRSSSNLFSQEINKAIYQDITGHPVSGSLDYYQAAQNYALYGKNFLDFPDSWQMLLNDKNNQNMVATDGSNLLTNFGQYIPYAKSNTLTSNAITPPSSAALTSAAAASAAAYYQLCNNMQTQGRPSLPNNSVNSTAYGIFLGNKVTYLAATPATPSLIYNQHSTTSTTNFISNSLANAALANSPAILYTNPMLTTTQQYLNTFFKETQYLSTALTPGNSTQSAASATSGGLYERLIYAQMLQQQLYQTQQAAAVAAMFQQKQRAAVAAAATRQSCGVNNNRTSSPQQHMNSASINTTTCNSNVSNLGASNRQVKSTSPIELLSIKTQNSTAAVKANGNVESLKTISD